jgi:uncharacterized membrane protein
LEKVNHVPQHTFMNLRELTITGLLVGITIFLGLTGYGFIPLPFMNATILHVPTIIGALMAGPKVGFMVGLLFGLFSFFQSLRAPSVLLQIALQYSVLADAFICIVPRMLIGVGAWVVFKHFPGNIHIKTAIAAITGSLLNTILFLGSLFVLVGKPIAEAQGISVDAVGALILSIVGINGVPEAIVCALIIVPVLSALRRARHEK